MAFPHKHTFSHTTTPFLLLILSYLAAVALPQSPRSVPTISQCGTSLLPIAACAPFVQGRAQTPAQPCCNNLKLVYNQQAPCLCLLLNESNLGSFPINHTLALQLPLECNLQVDISICSGSPPLPSTSPPYQLSSGTKTNSTVAASPLVMVTPRASILGLGFHKNAGMNLKRQSHWVLVIAAITYVLAYIC